MSVITNASIVSANKRERISGGFYITFITSDNVSKGANFSLHWLEKEHYFEVTDIEVSGADLSVKAIEVGYWGTKFDKQNDFDLRNLIGKEIVEIKNEETIKRINKESCWC